MTTAETPRKAPGLGDLDAELMARISSIGRPATLAEVFTFAIFAGAPRVQVPAWAVAALDRLLASGAVGADDAGRLTVQRMTP